MDTYLSISEASKITHVNTQVLKELVNDGKIKSIMTATGDILVNERDILARIPLTQRPEYAKFAHLAGVAINLSDAAKKYGIPQQTVSRWVQKGFIKRIGSDGRAVFIDEAEIATYANIYAISGGRQGKWIFNKDGTVYVKKA